MQNIFKSIPEISEKATLKREKVGYYSINKINGKNGNWYVNLYT
jgi:hypothetical protein